MGANGSGTAADPWRLTTPPGKGEYQMWRGESADPPALVCPQQPDARPLTKSGARV